jgi:iron complex outermembrane receptor protein
MRKVGMKKRALRMPSQVALVASAVMRALAGCGPLELLEVPIAWGEEVEPKALVADIPAQPLADALTALANQTGLQLVYVSDIVERQRSSLAHAGLRPQDALPRILHGTGLDFEYLTPRSVRILKSGPVRKTGALVANDARLDEIIVSANRRDEAVQNVPITMQVLTGATLSGLNATNFDDFVSYLPGVTAHGVGPAQSSIYVRGLGTTEFASQAAGTNGIFPNVATYFDEQSAQLPDRNLDIYAVDLDRIEVLEGPQGTLFGAGAEAGVVRYITNKPKLGATEGAVNGHYSVTAHGDLSRGLDAMINIPIVADKLALRGVIYDDRRGGYIDNIPATFARSASDASIAYANYAVGGVPAVPPNSVVINNAALVARNINPVTYKGIRVQALYQLDEAWSVLIAQTYQMMEADGVFTETATDSLGTPLAPLTTQLFNPSYDKDRFDDTAVTLNGHWRALDLVYAGAFSVRNVEQVQDYTNYARNATYADYYQCANPGATAATAQCFSPSSTWRDRERNAHQSHEMRVSTSAENRIRGVGGVFYEDYRIQDQDDWFYLTALPYFKPIAPPTGYYVLNGKVISGAEAFDTDAVFVPGSVTSNNPNVRPLGDAFFNDTTRTYQQKAAFASIDWDLVPHSLTLTTGTRYFRTTTSEVGSVAGSFGCSSVSPPVPNPCVNRESTDLDALNLRGSYSGFRSRASLSWRPGHDAMLYTTWSQGFRPGGFNRGPQTSASSPLTAGTASYQAQALLHGGFTLPLAYAPDNLTNTELGWRTEWFDDRMRWNGTLYQEVWSHAQVGAVGPEFGGTGAAINGGTYRVRGVETSAGLKITHGLSVDIGAAWNHGRLIKEGTYYWNDGTPVDFDTLHYANGTKVTSFGGALGSPLAGAPPFQGSIRARYEFDICGVDTSFQVGAVHQAHSLASTIGPSSVVTGQNAGAYDLAAFSTFEAALGVAKDGWAVQAYGQNLTDTRAELFANYYNFVKAVTVTRPRTVGVRLNYRFGDW